MYKRIIDPLKNRARVLAWQKLNPDKVREKNARWKQNHPEQYAAICKKCRANKDKKYDAKTKDYGHRSPARAVMSKHLKRPLVKGEVVHHDRYDLPDIHVIDNLILFNSQSDHMWYHRWIKTQV